MLTVFTFMRALNSAQGVFDITLLIINIVTFFYIRCYVQKQLRDMNQNRNANSENFKRDFKEHLEKKIQNEFEKVQMKITFLDELIDNKLQQEAIKRESSIKQFKGYVQGVKDMLKSIFNN